MAEVELPKPCSEILDNRCVLGDVLGLGGMAWSRLRCNAPSSARLPSRSH